MLDSTVTAASALACTFSAVALVAACGDDGPGGLSDALPRSGLLAVARADAAAPAPAVTTFGVRYDQSRTVTIEHPDVGTTTFVELLFPPQSILHVNGQPVCDTCTVTVTVSVTPGVYGISLTPASMIFNLSSTPTATFHFAMYGDLSVFDSSSRYASAQAFGSAVAIWSETLSGQWRRGRNSTQVTPGQVVSGIDVPGPHLLAAPK
jgi:hypothetical protein